jgi:hypothetical protein
VTSTKVTESSMAVAALYSTSDNSHARRAEERKRNSCRLAMYSGTGPEGLWIEHTAEADLLVISVGLEPRVTRA